MLCPYCRTENRPGATRCAACTSWMLDRPPAREWTRARDGVWLGGVARGLAGRFGLPVVAVRMAFVLTTIFAFWGLVVYLALWVLMPQEPLLLPPAPARPPEPLQSGPAPGP
jgi:phage shock protein PspC (stress-responsive transcriptional regulator)